LTVVFFLTILIRGIFRWIAFVIAFINCSARAQLNGEFIRVVVPSALIVIDDGADPGKKNNIAPHTAGGAGNGAQKTIRVAFLIAFNHQIARRAPDRRDTRRNQLPTAKIIF